MRKIKTINGHLIVQFHDRERRKDETLGRYGIIRERLYTGALKADRGAMDFDGIDTLEEAVELARELMTDLEESDQSEVLRLQKAFALACRILGGEDGVKIQADILERVDSEPVCRVCGCTEFGGCCGGCYWVKPDLCSVCADFAPEEGAVR